MLACNDAAVDTRPCCAGLEVRLGALGAGARCWSPSLEWRERGQGFPLIRGVLWRGVAASSGSLLISAVSGSRSLGSGITP